MTPFVSLIMTVYNRERHLPNAIKSVLSQSYKSFELIIWDDGSVDDSVDIARYYAKQDDRIGVVTASHKGRSSALKLATELTSARYLGWVDSDDLLAMTAVEETVKVLDCSPDIGMVYTDHMVIDEQGVVKEYGQRSLIPYSRERILTDFMTFHFRLIRRSVYDQVGGVDTSYSCNIDQELCLRISEITDVFHINKPLYHYRCHQSSISHIQRLAQIHCANRAIEEALVRRGIDGTKQVFMTVNARISLFQTSDNSYPLPNQSISLERNSWSMDTDSLSWLSSFLRDKKPTSVVECGSGLSTLLLAKHNLQSFLSLEHDKHWFELTKKQLEAESLHKSVDLKLRPLVQLNVNDFLLDWYDINQLTSFKADLILIDGPPGNNGILSRYPAPYLLRPYLHENTWLILDDGNRFNEREIVKLWLKEISELKLIERLSIGKGIVVMRYKATS